jgi:hypothetical protein
VDALTLAFFGTMITVVPVAFRVVVWAARAAFWIALVATACALLSSR